MDLELVKDFREICSMETLKQYLAKYNLVSRKPIVRQVYKVCTSLSNVLHEYVGIVNNLKVIVIHRWYDPSQAFSIEPDIEKIILQVFDSTGECLYGGLTEFSE